jgi:hypothetical protein
LRHVVQRFEDRHQVVLARELRIGGVADVELDAAAQAVFVGVLSGELDGRRIDVEAVDARERIALADANAAPAGAAAEVGDTCTGGAQALINFGDRG